MKEELLELLKKYAYKKGEFKLSYGKTSGPVKGLKDPKQDYRQKVPK